MILLLNLHTITLPPPCLLDNVVYFRSWASSLLHTFLFASSWYKLILGFGIDCRSLVKLQTKAERPHVHRKRKLSKSTVMAYIGQMAKTNFLQIFMDVNVLLFNVTAVGRELIEVWKSWILSWNWNLIFKTLWFLATLYSPPNCKRPCWRSVCRALRHSGRTAASLNRHEKQSWKIKSMLVATRQFWWAVTSSLVDKVPVVFVSSDRWQSMQDTLLSLISTD